MYVIGVDIGTGSTKALAIDATGKVLVNSQVPYPILNSTPSVSEQAPEIIWQAFVKCISRITTTLNTAPEAISLSSAMHSLIPVDDEGNALMNMITWADNRSSSIAKKLKQSPLGKVIYEETGTPIHPMSPLCKIIWLKENQEALFLKTKKFISIKEYIWFKLFNQFEIDYSIASATGLFNILTLSWHTDALALAGISTTRLSVPVNTNFIRKGLTATLAQLLGVTTEIPFLIGASDGCMANLGSYAIMPGVAALTIGTSGAIRVAGTRPVFNHQSMPFNYRLTTEILISGGPINNGGVALKWYAESLLNGTLSSSSDYDALLKPIESITPGSEGLIFLPYLLGERAPIWNSESCGVFFGITARHKQAHFTRAVIEGITMSLYQIAKTIESGGLEINQINVSGGFIHSHEWVQILANIFGKKICLINADDASATGAAFMGMKTIGMIEQYPKVSEDEIQTFLPDANQHRRYEAQVFPRFEQLYKALVLEMAITHDQQSESDEWI